MVGVKPSVKVGDVFESNKGGKYRVIEYNNYHDVLIEFMDEHRYQSRIGLDIIKKSNPRNPYAKTVFGVGHFGVGGFTAQDMESCAKKQTKEYAAWINMLSRCYYDRHITRVDGGKSYDGVEVYSGWLNFQAFAEWYVSNHPDYFNNNEVYSVDKELTHLSGDKVYSPETCFIIPQSINSMLKLGAFREYPEKPYNIHRQQNGLYYFYVENRRTAATVNDLSLREALDLRYQTRKLKLLEKVKQYEHVLPERTLAALYAFDYTREYDFSSIPED